jgi:DNA invertase Pin-like site-specific DNA recombinase
MAVHHRNTASSPTQEPPLTIARVALYARVSTCNGQDPDMQLRELREYAASSELRSRRDVGCNKNRKGEQRYVTSRLEFH